MHAWGGKVVLQGYGILMPLIPPNPLRRRKTFFYKPNTKDTQSHAQEFDAFYRCSLVYKKADVAVKGREAEYFLAI